MNKTNQFRSYQDEVNWGRESLVDIRRLKEVLLV